MINEEKGMSENEGSGIKPRKIVINPLRPAIIVVFILLLVVACVLFFPQRPWIGSYSTFNIVQKSTSTDYTLTIDHAIGGSVPVRLSRSVLWVVGPQDSFPLRIPLENITSKWSHGIIYLDSDNNSCVSPGDLIILQKPLYGAGTFVRIMNLDASASSESVCGHITLS
jgi:hypothetical protein